LCKNGGIVKELVVFALVLVLNAKCAMAQSGQPAAGTSDSPMTSPDATAATPAPGTDLTIHYKGPGVTAPEFVSFSGKTVALDSCKKLDGEEQLLIAVDRTGAPQIIQVLKSHGDLGVVAQYVVDRDRFKPGTVDGAPAIVAYVDDMKLESCRVERKDDKGQKEKGLELRSVPEQAFELIEPPKNALIELPLMPGTAAWTNMMQGLSKVGGNVTPPAITHFVDPQFSDEARVAKFQGICLISLIVDANGFPQNPRVVKPLGKGLDAEAIQAVKQFRFKPAMKDGKTPVPVQITVEVNFRLY
jgi:TonB family protein